MTKEAGLFFYRWLRQPLKIASVVPSSRAFGRSVASYVCNGGGGDTGFMIDLGAGTGVFAQALLDEGVSPSKIALLEKDPQLASYLKKRFPTVCVWEDDAIRLRQLVRQHKMNPVSLVLSGLPIPHIPWRARYRILLTIRRLLNEGGLFMQLTYLPFPSIPRRVLRRVGFRVHRRVFEMRNIPPASAWVFTACAPSR